MTDGDRYRSGRARGARPSAAHWPDAGDARRRGLPVPTAERGQWRGAPGAVAVWDDDTGRDEGWDRPGFRRGELSRSTLWEGGVDGPQPLRARWDPIPPQAVRAPRRQARSSRRRSSFGWFVHHYGWRAWALPVLTVLTVLAVVGVVRSPVNDLVAPVLPPPLLPGNAMEGPAAGTAGDEPTAATAPTVRASADVIPGSADPTVNATDTGQPAGIDIADARVADDVPATPEVPDAFRGVAMGVLPPGGDFAVQGAGTYHVVAGTTEPFGGGPDRRTFTIEVEDGISTPAADDAFAADVVAILSDERSWVGTGDFTLQRIDSGTPDFRVTLTSQMTIRSADNCGWDVRLEASCYNRLPGRVFINDARWERGAFAFEGDLASYRVYAINHEVGHALGFGHVGCAEQGGIAPVMMPQSWSTANDDIATLSPEGPVIADGLVCRANPFAD